MESKFKFQKPVYPTKSTYLTKYIYPEDITINSDDFVPITTGKYYEILKFIMSKKKLLQFKNGDDDTVLHMILNNGELTETEKKDIIIKMVNLWSAPVDNKNKDGIRPIHLAKNLELVKFLISKKVNINSRDNNGFTPLHYAVMPEGKKCKSSTNNMLKNMKVTDTILSNVSTEVLNILKTTKFKTYFDNILNIFKNDLIKINDIEKDVSKILAGDDNLTEYKKNKYDSYKKILKQSRDEINFKDDAIYDYVKDCNKQIDTLKDKFGKITINITDNLSTYIEKSIQIIKQINYYKKFSGKTLEIYNVDENMTKYTNLNRIVIDNKSLNTQIKDKLTQLHKLENTLDNVTQIGDIIILNILMINNMKTLYNELIELDKYNKTFIDKCKEKNREIVEIVEEVNKKIELIKIHRKQKNVEHNTDIYDNLVRYTTGTEYYRFDKNIWYIYKVTEIREKIECLNTISELYSNLSNSMKSRSPKYDTELSELDNILTIFGENISGNNTKMSKITKTKYTEYLNSEKAKTKDQDVIKIGIYDNIIVFIDEILKYNSIKNEKDDNKTGYIYRKISDGCNIQIAKIEEILEIDNNIDIVFLQTQTTDKDPEKILVSNLENGYKKLTETYTSITFTYNSNIDKMLNLFNTINGYIFIKSYLENKQLENICLVNMNLSEVLPDKFEDVKDIDVIDKYSYKIDNNFLVITGKDIEGKEGILTSDSINANKGTIKEIKSIPVAFKKEYTVINNVVDLLIYYIKLKIIDDFVNKQNIQVNILKEKIEDDKIYKKIISEKIDEILNETLENMIKFKSSDMDMSNFKSEDLIVPVKMSLIDSYYVQEIMDEYNVKGLDKDNKSDNIIIDTDSSRFDDSLCFEINKDIVEELLKNGADPNASEKTGKTPLYFSSMIGNEDVTQLLVSKGSKISTPTYNIYKICFENLKQLCMSPDFDSLNLRVIEEIEKKTQIDNMALKHSSSLVLKMTYYLLMHQLTHNIYMSISIKEFEKILGSKVKYDKLPLSTFSTLTNLNKENDYNKSKYDKTIAKLDEELTRIKNSIINLSKDEQTDMIKQLIEELNKSIKEIEDRKKVLKEEYERNNLKNKTSLTILTSSETSLTSSKTSLTSSRNICDIYDKFFNENCSNKGNNKMNYTYYLDLWHSMLDNPNNLTDGTQLVKLINLHILEKDKEIKLEEQIKNVFEKVLNKYGRDYHELPFYLKSTNYALEQVYSILTHVFKHTLSVNFINTVQYLIDSQKDVKVSNDILNNSGFVKFCLYEMPQKIIKNVCLFSESDEKQTDKTDTIIENALKMLETYVSVELLSFAQNKLRPFFNTYIETYVAEMHLLIVRQIKNCMNQYKIIKILDILNV